jgi:uncharacterized protein (TIGR03435 family)
MKSQIGLILALTALSTLSSQAQTTFDVVSIKTAPPDAGPRTPMRVDAGRVMYTNMTVKSMIQLAYDVPDWKITGEPAWVDSFPYDVVATFPPGVGKDQIPGMVKAMLADRFGLVAELQTKPANVYALKPDKNGAKLRAAVAKEQWNDNGAMNGGIFRGRIVLHNLTMSGLAELLSRQIGKPVLDQTGLEGIFDVNLKWAPSDTVDAASSQDGPSLVTALQEQLGLRLQTAKAPVELLSIIRVNRPAEN